MYTHTHNHPCSLPQNYVGPWIEKIAQRKTKKTEGGEDHGGKKVMDPPGALKIKPSSLTLPRPPFSFWVQGEALPVALPESQGSVVGYRWVIRGCDNARPNLLPFSPQGRASHWPSQCSPTPPKWPPTTEPSRSPWMDPGSPDVSATKHWTRAEVPVSEGQRQGQIGNPGSLEYCWGLRPQLCTTSSTSCACWQTFYS
jgi:hypothetical protein